MLRKIIGILANILLGFLTCPYLVIFITNIQDIYAMFGWIVLSIWLIILVCSEIAILKFLFKKNLYMWCVGIVTLFLSTFITFF